jgi:hypothetical protein
VQQAAGEANATDIPTSEPLICVVKLAFATAFVAVRLFSTSISAKHLLLAKTAFCGCACDLLFMV